VIVISGNLRKSPSQAELAKIKIKMSEWESLAGKMAKKKGEKGNGGKNDDTTLDGFRGGKEGGAQTARRGGPMQSAGSVEMRIGVWFQSSKRGNGALALSFTLAHTHPGTCPDNP